MCPTGSANRPVVACALASGDNTKSKTQKKENEMPIRHTDKGWMWGTKGPFPTKTKALQVARAAHANGYQQEENSMEELDMGACAEFVGALLHSATVTHFYHLQVQGAGADAAHRALAAYYDGIVEAVDAVAESIQGAYDTIIKPYPPMFANSTDEPLAYLKKLRDYVRTKREALPQDSEIQNEVDAVATLINRTCYRLERLK